MEVRELILEYLVKEEEKYIVEIGIGKSEENRVRSGWVEGFDYMSVEIPQRKLPMHPLVKAEYLKKLV